MSGEKEIPVDQEAGSTTVDSRHSWSFAGENSSLCSLGLAATIAETPRLPQNPHFFFSKVKLLLLKNKIHNKSWIQNVEQQKESHSQFFVISTLTLSLFLSPAGCVTKESVGIARNGSIKINYKTEYIMPKRRDFTTRENIGARWGLV